MSVQDAIDKYSMLPIGRVRAWDPKGVRTIELGIVFVLATWSGEALASLRRLTGLLASDFPNFKVPVLVWDADALTQGSAQALGSPIHGYGETFWVRNGRIIARLSNYRKPGWEDDVRRNTEILGSP